MNDKLSTLLKNILNTDSDKWIKELSEIDDTLHQFYVNNIYTNTQYVMLDYLFEFAFTSKFDKDITSYICGFPSLKYSKNGVEFTVNSIDSFIEYVDYNNIEIEPVKDSSLFFDFLTKSKAMRSRIHRYGFEVCDKDELMWSVISDNVFVNKIEKDFLLVLEYHLRDYNRSFYNKVLDFIYGDDDIEIDDLLIEYNTLIVMYK